ncbi:hypothetical protein KOR42_38700 [Thalassoglobus neptunius]|uniref:Uncharacterized protein n=1 Tax=Thalassoglobus neptunius TaxID=1938619 RepID=A0A5C5WG96_9PLAN|nr:hypothetical protein KOR42_38700 [Thalassoglobus neptunius]
MSTADPHQTDRASDGKLLSDLNSLNEIDIEQHRDPVSGTDCYYT